MRHCLLRSRRPSCRLLLFSMRHGDGLLRRGDLYNSWSHLEMFLILQAHQVCTT